MFISSSRVIGPRRSAGLIIVSLLSTVAPAAAQNPDLERGTALFADGKLAEAATVLTPLGNAHMQAALLLGRIAWQSKEYDDAAKWFEKAARLSPDSVAPQLWWGRAVRDQIASASFIRQPILARRAKSHFDKAIELGPKDVEPREDRAIFLMYSPSFMGGGVDKARHEADVVRGMDSYRGALLRIRIEEHARNTATVEAEYRALVKNYPDSAAPYLGLGLVLLNTQRAAEAFRMADDRLATLPNDPAALYQLGRAAALSGQQLERGEAALRAYMRLERPRSLRDDAVVYWRLGRICEQRGDTSGARSAYESALRINPEFTEVKQALAKLR